MPAAPLFKTLYRILSWSSLAGLIIVIVLVLRKSPAPTVHFDPNAAASAEKKFQAADEAKAAGQPGQVALNRTELNSYLAQNLQLEPAVGVTPAGAVPAATGSGTAASQAAGGNPPSGEPAPSVADGEQPSLEQVQSSVKDVKVDMDGDVVKAYVIFDFHGKDLSLELDGHLSADNGYMKFEPVSGKLGSLPLPQSTLDAAMREMMSSPENREKLRLPADISDIKIVDGQAVIQYKQ
ncbi:MAG: hypothetical protein WA211_13435 [Candidatus Acidiferrales bacterium]